MSDLSLVIASPFMVTPSPTEHLELLTPKLFNMVYPCSFRAQLEKTHLDLFVLREFMTGRRTFSKLQLSAQMRKGFFLYVGWCFKQLPNAHYELPSLQLVYE
jgi:hypothetical protein